MAARPPALRYGHDNADDGAFLRALEAVRHRYENKKGEEMKISNIHSPSMHQFERVEDPRFTGTPAISEQGERLAKSRPTRSLVLYVLRPSLLEMPELHNIGERFVQHRIECRRRSRQARRNLR